MSITSVPFSYKIQLVTESLQSLIKTYQTNPANYFYEEELRSELFNVLRNKFIDLSTNLLKDDWFTFYADNTINPVKAEYGKDSGYFSKYNISDIDIAVFSDRQLDDEMTNNFNRYCDIIIELKYSTEKFNSRHGGFIDDIRKIRNAKHNGNFLGLALCFDLHHFKDNQAEIKFIGDYEKSNIKFCKIETHNISLSECKCYAFYITSKEIFISQSLNSE